MDIGAPEFIIILIIVILVVGVGRLGKIGGELGGAIRQFREGLNGERDNQAAQTIAVPDVLAITPSQPEPTPVSPTQPAEPSNA